MADSISSTTTSPDATADAAGRTSPTLTRTPASDDSTPQDDEVQREEGVIDGSATERGAKGKHGETRSASTPISEKQTTPETPHATAPSTSPSTPGPRTEVHRPQRSEHDAGYFLLSPKPQRYLPIPEGAVPDPSPRSQSTPYTLSSSQYTESSPHLSREQVLAHTEASDRPPVFRDLSNSSVWSTASTIKGADLTAPSPPLSQVRSRDYPSFPNQAFSALQSQYHPVRNTSQFLRSRSSHNSNYSAYTSHSEATTPAPVSASREHSAANSPSLYTPTSSPYRPGSTQAELAGTYSTPYLHPTHQQVPKETHLAEKDVDPISGRRLINQYEIIDELGRGVHGKVKLGRNLDDGQFVAIKIVQRYSKRKRLGKNNSHESKIKQEIAILKKARHPNIVGLLEVIDDPSLQKVYIVLEHVQMGEVQWRVAGAEEVCLLEWRRCKREMEGIFDNDAAKQEDDHIYHDAMQHIERKQRREWRRRQKARESGLAAESWSLELGDEEDDFDNTSRASASTSNMSHIHSEALGHHDFAQGRLIADSNSLDQQANDADFMASSISVESPRTRLYNDPLEGTMYGAYDSVLARGRTPSITDTSSEGGWEQELRNQVPENYHYVPLMTLEQARQAFRDTVLGLDYLHYQGVIHRDIKPANLLQAADHHIKISDFGVSYLGREKTERTDDEYSESDAPDFDEAVELAKTVGTPAFYAPELCSTDLDPDVPPPPVTNAIDVWALGVTLYCLVFGRVPFYEENTFVLMRTIAEQDVYIPSMRLKAVELHSTSRPSSHGRMWQPSSSSKRLPHELEHEDVNDELKDLLKRMLTKDPKKRISLLEVKHHSWVVHDIKDKVRWLEETDPSKMSSGQKVEISKEDVAVAVVPVQHFIDRVKSLARRAGQAVGLTKTSTRSMSRRRAKSTATSASGDHSQPTSAASSSSTISQDARQEKRRPSMVPGEIIQALKASAAARENAGEHPLSQSVTASPEVKEFPEFFADDDSQPDSPMSTISQGGLRMKSTKRPSLDRTQTTISGNGSIRTIRPSDLNAAGTGATTLPALPSTPLEMHPTSNLQGIFSGTKHKLMKIGRSRSRSTTKFGRASPVDRALGDDDDAHAQPSLGLSDTTASGHVNSTSTLFEGSTAGSSAAASPQSSRAPSRAPSISSRSATDFLRPDFMQSSQEGNLSRTSSISSRSSRQRFRSMSRSAVPATISAPSYLPLLGEAREERLINPDSQLMGDSSEQSQRRAKEEQIRRLMLEVSSQERTASSTGRERAESSISEECPPSPDDIAYRRNPYFPDSNNTLTGYPSQSSQLVSSSSEDHFTGMSQSTSNPSIPSVLSANSSVQADDSRYLSNHSEQNHHRQSDVTASRGKAVDDHPHDDYNYDGDAAIESDGSDDSYIEMMPKKKKRSESVTIAELARSTGGSSGEQCSSIKSERSGSNNTMKKVKSSEDEEDKDRMRSINAEQ
ncbi:hypothetical protein FKW77_007117 [Venturia effusa]|uniref:non-specific serine/threonine protein kinase n=1 Tax=Venturia effusa TaxID=50376 RepID=A0A517LLT4_9PEZI|nr:hypothetical protein FKW77_007117 [Venturia effusa]